jgi:all-trans-retinol 13,14-reductase
MKKMPADIAFIVVGSGIAGLVFAALMARSGKKVVVLEAHEYPGGYGHTFQMGRSAKFNAQLHYVWNCGEGETVYKTLAHLGLEKEVTFESLDPDGFDHMKIPGYSLKIPANSQTLIHRLVRLFPDAGDAISKFVNTVERVAVGLDSLASGRRLEALAKNKMDTLLALRYLRYSLQDVFDKFQLPLAAQGLLASQWHDFLLPPGQLSFYAWVMLFTGYQRGAYYPTHHFEHVIQSLVKTIESNEGQVLFEHEVTEFVFRGKAVCGVIAQVGAERVPVKFEAQTVICNMDPKRAASMIGMDCFSRSIRQKLAYDYSPSNFMIYCTVEGIDLKEYGFGNWNTFHSGHQDINQSFEKMYHQHDYSNPSFAITTPGFMTCDSSDRPPGQTIVEFLTVANYEYFKALRVSDKAAYRKKKKEIIHSIFDVVEEHYIPDFRKHLAFLTAGTPTTNERYCWSAQGNSYGSNMTPENIGLGRLTAESSIRGLYFCNASSGFAGFAGTFWTGASLYQKLSGEKFL